MKFNDLDLPMKDAYDRFLAERVKEAEREGGGTGTPDLG
jgi:hypothetical protein